MALTNFNLVINYDTADQARIVNALIARYTTATFVPTQAQAIESFRQEVMRNIKIIVLQYEQAQATNSIAQVATFQ